MNWPGFVVALYLTIGSLGALGGLVLVLVAGRAAGLSPDTAVLASLKAGQRERIGRTRDLVCEFLRVIPWVAAWLVVYLAFRRRRDLQKVVDLRLRWPLDVIESVWLSVFSVVIVICVEVSGNDFNLRAACYAVVVATIAIPARWVIDGFNLRKELRTTLHNPIIQFTLITVTNFIALSLAASVLLQVSAHSPFRWKSVLREAGQIWGFGSLITILRAHPTGTAEILVAGAGLAVYVMLISQLFNPLGFRRTDDDQIEIAIRLLLTSDYDGAERRLQVVRANGPKLLPELVKAEGMLAMNTGDFALALQRAQAMAALSRLPTSPEDKDDGRRILAEWAEFFIRVDHGELHYRVVSYLIEDGIGDPCLATAVPALLFFKMSSAGGGKMTAWVGRQAEYFHHIAEEEGKPDSVFAPFASGRARLAQLPAGMTDPPYPLALATFETLSKKLSEAAERLLAMQRIRRLPERIVKRIVAGHVVVEDANQQGDFDRLRMVAVQDIVGLLNEAQNWRVTTLPTWLRVWLQDDIDQRLREVRFWGGKEIEPALQELHRFLVGASNETALKASASTVADLTNGKRPLDVTRALRAVLLRRSAPSRKPR